LWPAGSFDGANPTLVYQAVALARDLYDVRVTQQAIEQCSGERLVITNRRKPSAPRPSRSKNVQVISAQEIASSDGGRLPAHTRALPL
jgi:hypothetical protein